MSAASIRARFLDICHFMETEVRNLGFRCSPWAFEQKRGVPMPLQFTIRDTDGEEYEVIVRHLPRVENFSADRNVVEFPAHRLSMPPNPRAPGPFSPGAAA